jgi:hypothetical protein
MQGDSQRGWMLGFYAACGGFVGMLLGYVIDVLTALWEIDGIAFIVFCTLCGIFVGFRVGQKALFPYR